METNVVKMRVIKNEKITIVVKTLDEKRNPVEIPIDQTYSKLVFDVMNRPGDGKGFKYEEIKLLGRIEKAIDAIDKEKNELELELADFNILKEKLKTMTWLVPKKEYVDFTDYINSL